jgi:histidinol-phosphate aminotransferase
MSVLDRLRPGIQQVEALRLFDYDSAGPSLARLDCNELCLPPSEAELARFHEALARVALNRYPDVSGAPLRDILAQRWGVEPDQILLGNGSVELIALLTVALGGPPGASVLFPEPSFPQYEVIARTHGLRPVSVPLRSDFQLDEVLCLAALERDQPVLSLFASPNNPTGNRFDASTLLRLAAHTDGAFVVDEAYADFDGSSLIARRAEAPRSLLILRSLSKIGLAGLRIGALIGPPELIAALDRVRLPWNVNAVSLAIACAALADAAAIDGRLATVVRWRRELEARLSAIPGVHVFPSDANFLLVRTPREASQVERRLLAASVLVKNVSRPGLLERCLRISVGTPQDNERLVAALGAALASREP